MTLDLVPWLLGGLLLIAAVSFAFAFGSKRVANMWGAMDHPTGGRKIHLTATPLLGGLGIGLALCVGVLCVLGWSEQAADPAFRIQLFGFIASIVILMIGGALDDRYNLHPATQLGFIVAACLVAVLTGTNVSRITNWSGGAPIELGGFGQGLAFFWLLAVTLAIKFMDGLDGLVTGQTIIGALLIGALALTPSYFQPQVAILAVLVAGAFLGFLPFNFHPAKQFLGESGATIAGFTLGFLSILGGAKLATGLMALGLPLMDAGIVIIGRMVRGVSPFKGDDTHLHFKLLRAGLSQRQAVLLIWTISGVTGLIALTLQSIGKALLILWLMFVLIGLSVWSGKRKIS